MSRTRPRGGRASAWLSAVFVLLLAGCSAGSGAPVGVGPTPSNTTTPPTADASPSETPTPFPMSSVIAIAQHIAAKQKGNGKYGTLMKTGTDAIALTFDDGPDPTYTPQMLDLLKANDVKATFCVVGKRAVLRPDLLRRIVAEGHTLCNHSYWHDMGLGKMTNEDMSKDLRDSVKVIEDAVPGYHPRYLRAPGGGFTQALVDCAAGFGMRSLWWDIDPRDWDFAAFGTGQAMVNHILSVVQSQAHPGAIILSHDLGKPDTIAAYRILIPWLKARYRLAAMP